MSDLFEMSVYNDVVRYYKRKKYDVVASNLNSKGEFRYKLSPTGLAKNFSRFTATTAVGRGAAKQVVSLEINHNIKVQSAHHAHIYFTADVTVTSVDGVTTTASGGARRHSFIPNANLITFFEAKNMNPFPEILFSFSGIVLELMPGLINGSIKPVVSGTHLSPAIVFSGGLNRHCTTVAGSLNQRYGYNVIAGLYANKAQIYSFRGLLELP